MINTDYLAALAQRIQRIQQEVPQLAEIGAQMAGHLLAGGNIFVPPVSPYWASEFTGRAGGLMGIRTGDYAGPYTPTSDNDVAYLTLRATGTEGSEPRGKRCSTRRRASTSLATNRKSPRTFATGSAPSRR